MGEIIVKRYYKDGREMDKDFEIKSFPELEELLNKIYNRIRETKQQYQFNINENTGPVSQTP